MNKLNETWRGGLAGFVVVFLLGLVLWSFSIGQGLTRLSYDILHLFQDAPSTNEVLLIEMDERSYEAFDVEYGTLWPRRYHAKLLHRLTEDRAKLVVFDIILVEEGLKEENLSLAKAIEHHGNVVLAGTMLALHQGNLAGHNVQRPRPEFATNAAAWGLSIVQPESDGTIRRLFAGTDSFPSLPWAAAMRLKAPVTQEINGRQRERWMHYYGPAGTLARISYAHVEQQPSGFFANKIILVGGRPRTAYPGEEKDEFPNPYTRWDHQQFSGGLDIMGTMLLNLAHGDWLDPLSPGLELTGLALTGLLFGVGLRFLRPLPGAGFSLLGIAAVWFVAVLLFWNNRIWFGWMIIAGAQIPGALAWSVLSQWKHVSRETEIYKRAFQETARQLTPTGATHHEKARHDEDTPIPDHALLRCVGKGSYGEVWLARTALGHYDAVKIIHRSSFSCEAPYQREFRGIQKFMPISRGHLGWVPILHAGKNDTEGYFYYTMEAADDMTSGRKIDPEQYEPRTLSLELQVHGPLPASRCLSLFISLTSALHYLHQNQLIHRDIKPSNILFVNGVPKLADIGLVTDVESTTRGVTYVGTEGYIPPEGPGTPAADIFSLGMVCYQAAMGLDWRMFPELPTDLIERPDHALLLQLNNIIGKACMTELEWRYQSAEAMHADLIELQTHLGGR